MSRDPQLKKERNKAIKEAYAKLEAETVTGLNGKKERKYRRDAILALVSRKFYLAQDTISDIVLTPDDEDDDNQLMLFQQ